MNDIFIDMKEAKDSSAKIIEDSANINSDIEKLKEYIEYIKSSWDGNARDIFVKILNDYIDELAACSSLFKTDGEKLNNGALSYEKLEQHFINREI